MGYRAKPYKRRAGAFLRCLRAQNESKRMHKYHSHPIDKISKNRYTGFRRSGGYTVLVGLEFTVSLLAPCGASTHHAVVAANCMTSHAKHDITGHKHNQAIFLCFVMADICCNINYLSMSCGSTDCTLCKSSRIRFSTLRRVVSMLGSSALMP